jgi:N-acetyl-alpha-D-muramate 1-phosphate uridylyltransferase
VLPCVILAGGLGTRMRPLTDTIPKALLPVLGEPFASWQLRRLADQGVERVVYSIGHRGEMVRDHVGDGARWGMTVRYVDEGDRLRGTGGALRLALDEGALEEAFLLLYGDSYLPVELEAVERAWRSSGCPVLMTVLRNEDRWGRSNAILRDGRVVLYDKSRPAEHAADMRWIDYGLSVLSRRVVESRIPREEVVDLAGVMRDLSLGGALAGLEVEQRFYEVGSPQGLRDLEAHLAGRRLRAPSPACSTATGAGAEPAASTPLSRAMTWRALLWLALAPVALLVAVWRAPLDWGSVLGPVRHAHLLPYLVAVVVCYLSSAVRAVRWQVLLANAGERCGVAPLMGALLASFFVNCTVPGRVGDLYRAHLLHRHHGVATAKALGTIAVERVLDLAVVVGLLLAAGGLSLHGPARRGVVLSILGGLAVCGAAVTVLVLVRRGSLRRWVDRLPTPAARLYDGLRDGSVGSLGRWPQQLPLSVVPWILDSVRFGLVVTALGGTGLGPPQILLVTLVTALLSTVPLLPGGLGAVEGGTVVVLTSITGLDVGRALALVLLDRSITYGSYIVSGLAALLVMQSRPQRSPALGPGRAGG